MVLQTMPLAILVRHHLQLESRSQIYCFEYESQAASQVICRISDGFGAKEMLCQINYSFRSGVPKVRIRGDSFNRIFE
jgi:hypothetical protein